MIDCSDIELSVYGEFRRISKPLIRYSTRSLRYSNIHPDRRFPGQMNGRRMTATPNSAADLAVTYLYVMRPRDHQRCSTVGHSTFNTIGSIYEAFDSNFEHSQFWTRRAVQVQCGDWCGRRRHVEPRAASWALTAWSASENQDPEHAWAWRELGQRQ